MKKKKNKIKLIIDTKKKIGIFFGRLKNKLKSIKNNFLDKFKKTSIKTKFTIHQFLFRFRYYHSPKIILFIKKHSYTVELPLLIIMVVVFDCIVNPSMDRNQAITFFTTAGGVTAGTIPIIFSLIILLMDKAERIPSGFYNMATRNPLSWIIFLLIGLCSLTLFSFAIAYGTLNWGISRYALDVGIGIIALVFYLLFLLYKDIILKLNPSYVLKEIDNKAKTEISMLENKAKALAKIIQENPGNENSINNESSLATSYQYLKKDITSLLESVNYLFDFHDRLLNNREFSSSREVLTTIQSILLNFFEIRKKSAIILPTQYILSTTSDVSEFLTNILEKFVSTSEEYIKSGNTTGIIHILNIYMNLCISSSKFKYVNNQSNSNPVFVQCRGYLDQILLRTIKIRSTEGLFQLAIIYGKLGLVTIENGYFSSLHTICEKITEIASNSPIEDWNIIVSEAINSINQLLIDITFSDKGSFEINFKTVLESAQKITLISYLMSNLNYSDLNLTSLTPLGSPYQMVVTNLRQLELLIEQSTNPEEVRKLKNKLLIIVRELNRSIRKLSEKMKNIDHPFIDSILDVIEDSSCFLLDISQKDIWSSEKQEIINEILWLIHQPEWFIDGISKITRNNSLDNFIEAITKIGIKATELGEDEISKQSIEIISKFVNDSIDKMNYDGSGFIEPRLMIKCCYIGILAQKKGKTEIVDLVIQAIENFQPKYEAKWFPDGTDHISPSKNQLQKEVYSLSEEAGQIRDRLMDDLMDLSQGKILGLVSREDINNFIFKVWNIRV